MRPPRKVTIRKRKDRKNKPTVYWREVIQGEAKPRSATFDTASEAKDFAAQKYLELRSDLSPTAVPIDWDRLCKSYLGNKRANHCTELNIDLIDRTLKRFQGICGPLASAQINQIAIDNYKAERASAKRRVWKKNDDGDIELLPAGEKDKHKIITPAQLNKELRILKAFVRWMQGRNYNKHKIVFEQVREHRKVPRILSDREIANLKIEAAKQPDMHCRVSIILGTAQRAGAVERLGLADIDVEQNRIHFREKGQRDRILPVTEKVMQVIVAYTAELRVGRKWLFHLADPTEKHLSMIFPRKRWNKMVETARLEGVTPHDLRETCATLLAKNNVSAVIAQRMLGHGSLNTTMKYYINSDDEKMLRDAVGELPG